MALRILSFWVAMKALKLKVPSAKDGLLRLALAEYARPRASRISWKTMLFMPPPKYSLYRVLSGSPSAVNFSPLLEYWL